MIKRYTLKTGVKQKGQRLDAAIAEWLPVAISQPLSKAKIRTLIVAGAVYLNGKRVRIASKELLLNATIDVYLDLKKITQDGGQTKVQAFELTSENILFEDDYIIAVDKPAGLPTQPTLDEARVNLFAAVKKYLQKRNPQREVYLAMHHRLDRDTSGVIIFGKDKRANLGIAKMFSEHTAQKTYHAFVELDGPARKEAQIGKSWQIRNYLGKVNQTGKQSKFGTVRSGGDAAHTDFKWIELLGPSAAWVEAKPRTGRTHQIRVHLSEAGFPILADPLYGAPGAGKGKKVAPRMMLHAKSLSFPHPIDQKQIVVESPHPRDFAECLVTLRKLNP